MIALSSTLPYGLEDWERFVDRHLRGTAEVSTLGCSTEGRKLPLVVMPGWGGHARLVFTARHHACEATASLVLEGVLLAALRRWLSGAPAPDVVAIPFVDLDGVERGDQGKGRLPHDHNRDYGDAPRYPETAAVSALPLSPLLPTACIDLHTPGIRGPLEEAPLLICSSERKDQATAAALSRALVEAGAGDVQTLVFEEDWNRADYKGGQCFTAWARSRPGVLGTSIVEYPNAVDRGKPVTVKSAREFGAQLFEAASEAFPRLH